MSVIVRVMRQESTPGTVLFDVNFKVDVSAQYPYPLIQETFKLDHERLYPDVRTLWQLRSLVLVVIVLDFEAATITFLPEWRNGIEFAACNRVFRCDLLSPVIIEKPARRGRNSQLQP